MVYRASNARKGDVAGSLANGYVMINLAGEQWQAHRLAWFYMTGLWPHVDVDHEDLDRSNNRWVNLRLGTRSFNMQNQVRAHKENTSGLLGVSWEQFTGRWKAQIRLDGKTKSLGRFKCRFKAHEAYLTAKRLIHPGCTI